MSLDININIPQDYVLRGSRNSKKKILEAIDMRDENIRNTIIQKLRDTQETNAVRILLAIESGSRGWGFASPDSDYDCRFVYAHEKDWYLSVVSKTDIIEYAADKTYDINGWDLRKFISHIVKSNAVMFEWLSSNVVYISNDAATALLRRLEETFFNPVAVSHHYLSLARKKYNEIIGADTAKLKKYFYVIRPLVNVIYIEQHGKMPYMEYYRTLAEIEIPRTAADEIGRLAYIKKTANESYAIPLNKTLTDFFAAELAGQDERLKTLKFNKNRDYEQADECFRKIIEMTWNNG